LNQFLKTKIKKFTHHNPFPSLEVHQHQTLHTTPSIDISHPHPQYPRTNKNANRAGRILQFSKPKTKIINPVSSVFSSHISISYRHLISSLHGPFSPMNETMSQIPASFHTGTPRFPSPFPTLLTPVQNQQTHSIVVILTVAITKNEKHNLDIDIYKISEPNIE